MKRPKTYKKVEKCCCRCKYVRDVRHFDDGPSYFCVILASEAEIKQWDLDANYFDREWPERNEDIAKFKQGQVKSLGRQMDFEKDRNVEAFFVCDEFCEK